MKIKQSLASCIVLLASCFLPLAVAAQSAFSIVEKDYGFMAGNHGVYPDKHLPLLTPAPEGYTPFYISHYGRHGSRYLNDMKAFLQPYNTLQKADSLGKLTAIGQTALKAMRQNIADAEGRWGDLTELGNIQQRHIAHRMVQNFPQVFNDDAFIDARSTIVTRCVLSMGAAVLQLVKERPQLQVSMNNSYSDMWYLNHQNRLVRDSATNHRAGVTIDEFVSRRWHPRRIMNLLFNDSTFINKEVSARWTVYYLIKAALLQENSQRSNEPNPLLQLFTIDDLYTCWKVDNAWSYITSGFCQLNGAKQPCMQHFLLRQIINEADNIIDSRQHGASLRFGHETVLLPLVCLMGINGFDYRTDNLEELEAKGWWASMVYPMAGNLQIVFYRKNADDRNPLLKVLLNEKEAVLPLPSDLAPYYRWSDFRDFYLRRVAEAESTLAER